MAKKQRPWTLEEERLLREKYLQWGYAVIALFPYRSKSSVVQKMKKMGLKVESFPRGPAPWDEDWVKDKLYEERKRREAERIMAEEELRLKSRIFALRRLRRLEARFQTHRHQVYWLEDVLKLLKLDWTPKRGWKLLFYDASEYSKILKGAEAKHLEGCVSAGDEKFYAVKSRRGEIVDIAEVKLPTNIICILADVKGFDLVKLVAHEFTEHLLKEAHKAYVEGPNAFFKSFDGYTKQILENPQVPADLKLLTEAARKQCAVTVEQIDQRGYWANEDFIDKTVSLLIRMHALKVEEPADRAERLFLWVYEGGPSQFKARMKKLTGRDRNLQKYFASDPEWQVQEVIEEKKGVK